MEPHDQKRPVTNTLEGFMSQAYALIDQNRHFEAREILHQLLNKIPNQPNCLFGLAIIYFKEKHLNEAKRILYKLTKKFPNSIPAIEYLALILFDQHQLEEAKFYIEKCLAAQPTNAFYQRNLAYLYQRERNYKKAKEYYENALALKHDYGECLVNLGFIAEKEHEKDKARGYYQKIIQLNPNCTEALIGLGNLSLNEGNWPAAKEWYDKGLEGNEIFKKIVAALALSRPTTQTEYACAFMLLGDQCVIERKWFLGQICIETYIRLMPTQPLGFIHLGNLYKEQSEYRKAASCYDQALKLDKTSLESLMQLGNIYSAEHQYAIARKYYEKALELEPNHLQTMVNLAASYDKGGEFKKAEELYHQAIKLHDDNKDMELSYFYARYNLGFIQLRNRNYQEGWENYQFRKKILPTPYIPDIQKLESVENLNNKKIIILNDQGFGDLIQFIRFCKKLKEAGCFVKVSSTTEICKLLNSCPYVDESSDFYIQTELSDYQQLFASDLPYLFHITEKDLIDNTPYLFAHEEKLGEVCTFLVGNRRLKVGLCYQGSRRYQGSHDYYDAKRSVSLEQFSPLFKNDDVDFYSLVITQYGNPIEEYNKKITDLRDHINDFNDLAGIIQKLDLVITVDTSVAHLAGAMHKPCWILIPEVSDWRWQLDREDSPWYPSARLYRQSKTNNWDDVIKRIAKDLSKL